MNKILKMQMDKIKWILIVSYLLITSITFSFADSPSLPITEPIVIPVPSTDSVGDLSDSIVMSQCQGLFAGGFNPQDNLMSSIMGLCLSGILVNLHRLEQNQCEKIICEYNAARQGLSPIACAKQSAYNTCLITGQGFDVIEGVLIGALRQNIRQILEDPLGFGISRIQDTLKQQTTKCPGGVCTTTTSKTASIALAVLEIPNAIQTIKNLINQLQSLGQSRETACERLEDIRKELEQLVAQQQAQIRR